MNDTYINNAIYINEKIRLEKDNDTLLFTKETIEKNKTNTINPTEVKKQKTDLENKNKVLKSQLNKLKKTDDKYYEIKKLINDNEIVLNKLDLQLLGYYINNTEKDVNIANIQQSIATNNVAMSSCDMKINENNKITETNNISIAKQQEAEVEENIKKNNKDIINGTKNINANEENIKKNNKDIINGTKNINNIDSKNKAYADAKQIINKDMDVMNGIFQDYKTINISSLSETTKDLSETTKDLSENKPNFSTTIENIEKIQSKLKNLSNSKINESFNGIQKAILQQNAIMEQKEELINKMNESIEKKQESRAIEQEQKERYTGQKQESQYIEQEQITYKNKYDLLYDSFDVLINGIKKLQGKFVSITSKQSELIGKYKEVNAKNVELERNSKVERCWNEKVKFLFFNIKTIRICVFEDNPGNSETIKKINDIYAKMDDINNDIKTLYEDIMKGFTDLLNQVTYIMSLVNDIITDLREQLNEYEEEIQKNKIVINYMKKNIDKLNEEKQELIDKNAELKAQLTTLKTKKDKYEKQLEEAKTFEDTAKKNYEDAMKQLEIAQKEYEANCKILEEAKMNKNNLYDKLQSLYSQRDEIKKKQDNLMLQGADLLSEEYLIQKERLENEKAKNDEMIAEYQRRYDELNLSILQYEKDKEDSYLRLQYSQEYVDMMYYEYTKIEQERMLLEEKNKKLEQEIDTINNNLKETEDRIREIEEEKNIAQYTIDDFERENIKLRQLLEEKTARLNDIQYNNKQSKDTKIIDVKISDGLFTTTTLILLITTIVLFISMCISAVFIYVNRDSNIIAPIISTSVLFCLTGVSGGLFGYKMIV